jgi:hypothetical protein
LGEMVTITSESNDGVRISKRHNKDLIFRNKTICSRIIYDGIGCSKCYNNFNRRNHRKKGVTPLEP